MACTSGELSGYIIFFPPFSADALLLHMGMRTRTDLCPLHARFMLQGPQGNSLCETCSQLSSWPRTEGIFSYHAGASLCLAARFCAFGSISLSASPDHTLRNKASTGLLCHQMDADAPLLASL